MSELYLIMCTLLMHDLGSVTDCLSISARLQSLFPSGLCDRRENTLRAINGLLSIGWLRMDPCIFLPKVSLLVEFQVPCQI